MPRKMNAAAPVATPAPAAPMTRAQVMERLDKRIGDNIDDRRRSIARTLEQKRDHMAMLANAMTCQTNEERGGTLGGCLYSLASTLAGPRDLHEQAGELAVWLGIEACRKESIEAYGMSDEALIAELIATNLREALEDSNITGSSSTCGFTNAISHHTAEGRHRARRNIHTNLISLQAMLAAAI